MICRTECFFENIDALEKALYGFQRSTGASYSIRSTHRDSSGEVIKRTYVCTRKGEALWASRGLRIRASQQTLCNSMFNLRVCQWFRPVSGSHTDPCVRGHRSHSSGFTPTSVATTFGSAQTVCVYYESAGVQWGEHCDRLIRIGCRPQKSL